jgi:hypothetical protein
MAIRSGVPMARHINGIGYTRYILTKAGEDYVYKYWSKTTIK